MIKPQTKINSRSEYFQFCRKSLKGFFENRKVIIYYLRDNSCRTLLRYEPDMKVLKESIEDLSRGEILEKVKKIKAKEVYSRGIPYGVLIAFNDGSDIRIGYNFCTQESFVKSAALIKAINKSQSINQPLYDFFANSPHSIREDMPSFLQRISRYFRLDGKLVESYDLICEEIKRNEEKELENSPLKQLIENALNRGVIFK